MTKKRKPKDKRRKPQHFSQIDDVNKESSRRTKASNEKYGENVREPEAMQSTILQGIVCNTVVSVLGFELIQVVEQDTTQVRIFRITVQEMLQAVSFKTDGET